MTIVSSLTKCDLQERVQRNAREVAGCDSGNFFALIFPIFSVATCIFAISGFPNMAICDISR